MKVNGIEITAKKFAFDGCHKIYLLETKEEVEEAVDAGYGTYPISKLKWAYETSCPLRFINGWNLKTIVGQGEEAEFVK